MCFKRDGKTAQATRCIKSRIMSKVIDSVLLIDTFEQKYVVLKVMLQSLRLKYHQKLSKNCCLSSLASAFYIIDDNKAETALSNCIE